ncbi:MAG TPA: carboxylesterase family protein [Rhizomicrobium sp.]|jgi:para-nitrobenzyl esterase
MCRIAAVLIAVSLSFASASAADGPVIKIDSGALSGTSTGTADVYKDIPYAAAPVGALRWEPPALPAGWTGTRDASQYGPICPQPPRPEAAAAAVGANLPQSEDCLSLNVWAPKAAKNAPVMVWIHGGAHRFGSGASPLYDGSAFARDGVVLVTINYRLGILGYFAHPALTAAAKSGEPLGNYGAMDQIAALQWVQRNIAAFGGDPRNVTVFGESAGGASILYLLATPSAKGLFAKAIVESGGGWSAPETLAPKEAEGVTFARNAGLADATVAQLRALPVDKTLTLPVSLGFGPFVDGRLIPETPAQAFASGHAIDVPLLIGSNSFEASLMKSFSIPAANILNRLTPAERAIYGGETTNDEALAEAVFTDFAMGAPAHWTAAQASTGAPSWLYHFSYVPTLMRGRVEGARHGSEIPFVFDTLSTITARFNIQPTPEDSTVETEMHAAWVAFAKTGNPGWTAYTPANDTLMEFDSTSGPKTGFRKTQYDALDKAMLPRLDLHRP